MDLFAFNPPSRQIIIDDGCYELGPFSIKIMSLIIREYGDLGKFNKLLLRSREKNSDVDKVLIKHVSWLCFKLLKEIKTGDLIYIKPIKRNIFQGAIFWLMFWKKDEAHTDLKTFAGFYSRFVAQKRLTTRKNIESIFLTIQDSGLEKSKTSKKPSKKTEPIDELDNNFSESYATIAKELNYKIDEFYELTPRQINQIQKDLNRIKSSELEFMAGIHGAKINKPRDNRLSSEINFTPDQDRKMKEFIKERQAILKKERPHLYN